uniref:Uncharacterized protein n=1 Tax=Rhizophora mucronata TaxID=61149 RepID=A0A2P2N380_RHIMU
MVDSWKNPKSLSALGNDLIWTPKYPMKGSNFQKFMFSYQTLRNKKMHMLQLFTFSTNLIAH